MTDANIHQGKPDDIVVVEDTIVEKETITENTKFSSLLNYLGVSNRVSLLQQNDILAQKEFMNKISQFSVLCCQFLKEELLWCQRIKHRKASKILDEVSKSKEFLNDLKKLFEEVGNIKIDTTIVSNSYTNK